MREQDDIIDPHAIHFMPGLYRGIVKDNSDPQKLYRLKVAIPSVFGDDVLEWAYPRGFYCGDDRGGFALPDKEDLVWIEFEHGDPSHPVWSHGSWSADSGQSELPEEAVEKKAGLKTRTWKVIIDDSDGAEKLNIETIDGDLKFEMSVSDGKLIMKVPQKIEILAPEVNVGGDTSSIRGGVQTSLTHPVCQVTGLPIGSAKKVKAYGD